MFIPLLVALFVASSVHPAPPDARAGAECPELAVDAERVRVGLPDARIVVARRTQVEASARGFTWVGRVEGDVDGVASFAVVDDVVSGTLWLGDEVFELGGELGGRCVIEAVDPQQFPACTPAAVTAPLPGGAIATPPPPGSSLASASTIDVLVVYTPQARAAQGGTSQMEALIDLSLAAANNSYANSGVLQRVRLVARAELVGYTQSASILTELSRLTIPNDGFIDSVHALRDACGADAVCMLIQTNASCGASNQFSYQGSAFAPYAMCVVARSCAASNLSVAHELGHLMGLAHDRDTSTKKCSRASIVGYETQVMGASSEPSVSITGSIVAFTSAATTLVPGDTNGFTDVFVRDRGLLTTARANVSSAGLQANAPSVGAPSVGGGRYVAFASGATNLVGGDTNGVTDVFVRDLQTGTTDRILPAPGGLQADGESRDPSIASGERWIVFTSWAPNLGAGPPTPQVYRWDRLTNTTVLVSAAAGGAPGNAASGGARVADDGRVAFWSAASDLVAGDANGAIDVFLRDVAAGTTTRMSVSTSGAEIAGPCEAVCAISADGRRVAFATASSDVVAGDANGVTDLYVRDRLAATTLLASANGLGATGSGPSSEGFAPSFSNDGRYVAFQSHANDLVAGDTNNASDVFLRDLTTGTTERVSLSSSGAQIAGGGGEGAPVAISGYANHVVFVSRFAVEVADTNGVNDVYVFDRQEPYPPGHSAYAYGFRTPDNAYRTIMAYEPGLRVPYFSNPGVSWQGRALGIASPSPFAAEAWRTLNDTAATVAGFRSEVMSAYCLGDGSATPCPCGNASATSDQAGCLNSLNLAGRLVALGGASISADSLVLRGSGMPDSSALFFQGTTPQSGGAGAVFGDGLRCAAGNVRRLAIRMNTSGSSALPSNGSASLSIVGGITAPTTAYYQVWYRNSATFCSASTFNLTNALSVAWRP